ncbi:PadR family transcriptional regulator [Dyadobacter luticola]|uniref:PadR family transcriptional regulator n=1 Tax=Dyadobacter luticola TaxID=1979387 RepID=A0A5R9KL94_9BACT|nr:helix-turn-helix transcriptional regulator [Dyadobacter luticola]TLU96984.1 PadR family transcriptional regulator [Dyadobacter luticola]
MSRTYLGEFEELVLLAVAVLELQSAGAYGVSIADELKLRTQRTTSVTGVHVVLYRLEEKGLVGSELGGASQVRGGRRKRLFTLTAAGQQVLREMRQLRLGFWEALPTPFFS